MVLLDVIIKYTSTCLMEMWANNGPVSVRSVCVYKAKHTHSHTHTHTHKTYPLLMSTHYLCLTITSLVSDISCSEDNCIQ